MHLIDIGANLTNSRFNKDLDSVLERALQQGVQQQIVTGTDLESSRHAIQLSEQHPKVLFATAGFHPHHAKDNTDQAWQALQALWQRPQVVAIGETGLDFNRNFSTPQQQLDSFERHLQAACEQALPLFLHERDAEDAFYELLSHYRPKLQGAAVLHCFTGSANWLKRLLELDIYYGITGWACDERRGLDLREAISLIPEQRLLIETDAPYLLPRDMRPKPKSSRNEPSYLPHIAQTVAHLRGESVAHIAAVTTRNCQRIFQI
ncbi:MAG: TatD family hydrolase [Gammaproteobacteria bacterium]|nr:TatD family hydrolase [Gammaproteobacteria bacterium]